MSLYIGSIANKLLLHSWESIWSCHIYHISHCLLLSVLTRTAYKRL